MTTRTLADLSVPAEALRRLMVEHGNLPVASMQISPIYPGRLDVSLHPETLGDETSGSTKAAFETWRQALGIASETVKAASGRGSTWLTTDGAFDGAKLRLTAFLPDDLQEES
ncbi:hypothetical protein [Streptomyces albireticuli]|uniref:Uncharacterized protein n=1 Tax=Streptomyces albireticuli TaxID=1940 RepID=A0A2A2D4H6_9ACTN|nr:hypothetical protein [Streptomyces albireticuli]MCD9194254.1 hypothetical protein [Streptomyces albireticuli]PAU47388.1 hypothetical protein CK936_19075 [Streptomyces albireticuli]